MPFDPERWANVAVASVVVVHGSLAEVLGLLCGTGGQSKIKNTKTFGRVRPLKTPQNMLLCRYHRRTIPTIPTRIPTRTSALRCQTIGSRRSILPANFGKLMWLNSAPLSRLCFAMATFRWRFTAPSTLARDSECSGGLIWRFSRGHANQRPVVSYVAPAPMWKPGYRGAPPEKPCDKALLQAGQWLTTRAAKIGAASSFCLPPAFSPRLGTTCVLRAMASALA